MKEKVYKPPFRYDSELQFVVDSNGNQLCQMRGWSFLSKAWGPGQAFEIQDDHGEMIVHLLNNCYGKSKWPENTEEQPHEQSNEPSNPL